MNTKLCQMAILSFDSGFTFYWFNAQNIKKSSYSTVVVLFFPAWKEGIHKVGPKVYACCSKFVIQLAMLLGYKVRNALKNLTLISTGKLICLCYILITSYML